MAFIEMPERFQSVSGYVRMSKLADTSREFRKGLGGQGKAG
jgi:hypothetical protein